MQVRTEHHQADAREFAAGVLGNDRAMRFIYDHGFKPTVDAWKSALLYNTKLTEGERLGYQHALAALEKGFYDAYKDARIDVPEWLQKEFRPLL